MARIIPVMMPGIARGSTMRWIVCHLLAPQAKDPSRIERGTAANASSVATITTGSVSSDSVRAAQNKPPVPNVGLGSLAENNTWSMDAPMM